MASDVIIFRECVYSPKTLFGTSTDHRNGHMLSAGRCILTPSRNRSRKIHEWVFGRRTSTVHRHVNPPGREPPLDPVYPGCQTTSKSTKQGSNVRLKDGIIHSHGNGDFSYAHLNIRSIINKFDQFKVLFSRKLFDVIMPKRNFL